MPTQHADFGTLENDVTDQIHSFKKKRDRNRSWAFRVALMTSVLSAATTVVVGITGYWKEAAPVFNVIALVMSASVTVVLSLDRFFNHKKLWITYTGTLVQLYDLYADMKHLKAVCPDFNTTDAKAAVDSFYGRYKSILSKTNKDWATFRNSKKDTRG